MREQHDAERGDYSDFVSTFHPTPPLPFPARPTLSSPINLPQVLKSIDVVIDETYSATPPSYTIDSFKAGFELTDGDLTNASETSADYPFLASSRVYKTDKRLTPLNSGGSYGTDWMESGLPHADMALLDFALILIPQLKDGSFFHPGEGSVDLRDRPTRWLRNIATGEDAVVVDPSECDNPNKLGSSLFAVCPGDAAAPPAPLPFYNFCADNDFCITTSHRANIVTIAAQVTNAAKMQATIAVLQADNARLQAGTIKLIFNA